MFTLHLNLTKYSAFHFKSAAEISFTHQVTVDSFCRVPQVNSDLLNTTENILILSPTYTQP